jgi:hypothetical protein
VTVAVVPREHDRYEPWHELLPVDEWVLGVGYTLSKRLDERDGGLLLCGDDWEVDCFMTGRDTGAWGLYHKEEDNTYRSAFCVPREMFDAEPERWLAEIEGCLLRSAQP